MRFRPLFRIRITHPFYEEGRCDDLKLVPTPDTARRLRGHRCLWLPADDGGEVVVAVDHEDRAFLPFAVSTQLGFTLHPRRPEFALVTDLARFSEAARGARPEVAVFYAIGTGAAVEQLALRFEPLAPAPSSATKAPPCLEAVPVLARVLLTAGEAFPVRAAARPVGPRELRVAFEASSARWVYYVVTNLDSADFEIENPASENPIAFDDPVELGESDPDDLMAARLQRQFGEWCRFRIVSRDRIPLRRFAPRRLVLRSGAERVVDPLPIPSLQRFSVLGAGSSAEPSLFQVVKHLVLSAPNRRA